MSDGGALLAWAVVVPLLGALPVSLLGRWPNVREAASLFAGVALFAVVLSILRRHLAGETLSFVSHKRETGGLNLRRYATTECGTCPMASRCTTTARRVVTRWEHEHLLDAVQQRLDENPQAMRVRRETVEHPFGTIKMRMGATHFLMKRLHNVKTEIALSVLAYNLTRVINIMGVRSLMAAIKA